MKLNIEGLDDTKKLSHNIARFCCRDDVICLKGDLGAGKTTFTKFFINFFSDEEIQVQSPTFNIVFPYEFEGSCINHFDLYRIKSIDELDEIGFYESLDENMSIIEWPQIAEAYLPEDRLEINFCNLDNRFVELKPFGKWVPKILALRQNDK